MGGLKDSEDIAGDLGEAPELSGDRDSGGMGTVEGLWLIAGGRKELGGGEAEQHQDAGTGPCSHRHRGNSVPSTNGGAQFLLLLQQQHFPPSDTGLKKTV